MASLISLMGSASHCLQCICRLLPRVLVGAQCFHHSVGLGTHNFPGATKDGQRQYVLAAFYWAPILVLFWCDLFRATVIRIESAHPEDISWLVRTLKIS